MADCLFCKIILKEIDAKIAYEDESILAFHDINPQAPTHLLIIPKEHVEGIDHMEPSHIETLGKVIYGAKKITQENGWSDYRLVFNNGAEAGQSVFHIHLHLLSGRPMMWPPG